MPSASPSDRNQQEITVRGSYFVQEDSPADIGRTIAAFLRRLPR